MPPPYCGLANVPSTRVARTRVHDDDGIRDERKVLLIQINARTLSNRMYRAYRGSTYIDGSPLAIPRFYAPLKRFNVNTRSDL